MKLTFSPGPHARQGTGHATILRDGQKCGHVVHERTGWRAEAYGIGNATGPTRELAARAALAGPGAALVELSRPFLEWWDGTGAAQGSDTEAVALLAAEVLRNGTGVFALFAADQRGALECLTDYAETAAEILYGDSPAAARSCARVAERLRGALAATALAVP